MFNWRVNVREFCVHFFSDTHYFQLHYISCALWHHIKTNRFSLKPKFNRFKLISSVSSWNRLAIGQMFKPNNNNCFLRIGKKSTFVSFCLLFVAVHALWNGDSMLTKSLFTHILICKFSESKSDDVYWL